jgi:hypothetical protein
MKESEMPTTAMTFDQARAIHRQYQFLSALDLGQTDVDRIEEVIRAIEEGEVALKGLPLSVHGFYLFFLKARAFRAADHLTAARSGDLGQVHDLEMCAYDGVSLEAIGSTREELNHLRHLRHLALVQQQIEQSRAGDYTYANALEGNIGFEGVTHEIAGTCEKEVTGFVRQYRVGLAKRALEASRAGNREWGLDPSTEIFFFTTLGLSYEEVGTSAEEVARFIGNGAN